MTTLVISGEIVIDPDDFDAALAIVEPLVAATRQEAGCLAYDFWVDPRDRGRFRVFEELGVGRGQCGALRVRAPRRVLYRDHGNPSALGRVVALRRHVEVSAIGEPSCECGSPSKVRG